MKKVLSLLSIAFAITVSAQAQDLKSRKGENYLPEKGDWSIGFRSDGIFNYIGNAFNGSTSNSAPSVGFIQQGAFVGKIFTSDKTATRYIANLGIGMASNETRIVFAGTPDEDEYTGDWSDINVTLGYGKEWRRGKTRLQGFYGADALLNIGSQTFKEKINGEATGYEEKSGTSIGVTLQGFVGAEYFIFPKISVGAQYSYGVGFTSTGASETKNPGQPTEKGKSSSSFNLGGVGVTSMSINLHF